MNSTTHTPQQAQDEQTKLWNGPAGRAWVQAQDILDKMLQPFEDALLAQAAALRQQARRVFRVLDVGCGTGSTTLAIARQLAGEGDCVGVDISAPMIAAAQHRAAASQWGAGAHFICDNAQTRTFTPASFDLITSRFGVMFFDDPVRAFKNLRDVATTGAALRFVAWRSAADNPFMTAAERAAAPLLPALPARKLDGPGQFAFADPQRIVGILTQSGWADVDIQPIDVPCTLPEAALTRYISWLGPVGVALQQMDETSRAALVEQIRPAFDAYVDGADVRFNAACWMVKARAA